VSLERVMVVNYAGQGQVGNRSIKMNRIDKESLLLI
jgi:hypothetical protein